MKTRIAWIVLSVVISATVVTDAYGAVTVDSATWEGAYEATDTPVAELGFNDFGAGAYSTVSGGVLRINTIGADLARTFEKWPGNPLSPSVDFATGTTLEFRVKLNQSEGAGAAMFSFFDANDLGVLIEINAGEINFPSTGHADVATTDDFHTYRITFDTSAGTVVNVYCDNNITPLLSMNSLPFSNQGRGPNALMFGDGHNSNDADWEIDYIRWTGAGVFAPVPEPTSLSLAYLAAWGALLRRR